MKKKSFVVIIILLVIVILGLCAFIAYDKGVFNGFLTKESDIKKETIDDAEKVEEEKEEELDTNSNEIVSLIQYFDIFNDSMSSFDLYARMYKSSKVTVDDLSNSEKGYIAVSNILDITGTEEEISATDVENMVKKIFGDVNYVNGDIPNYGCAFGKISYLSGDNIYKTSNTGCGGVCNPNIKYEIINVTKKGDTLNITVAVAYQTCEDKTGNFYPEYYSDMNYTNKLYEDRNNSFDIKNFLDKLDKYTYTFKLDNKNDYVFVQVEKEK